MDTLFQLKQSKFYRKALDFIDKYHLMKVKCNVILQKKRSITDTTKNGLKCIATGASIYHKMFVCVCINTNQQRYGTTSSIHRSLRESGLQL
jgi:hypothetical protein